MGAESYDNAPALRESLLAVVAAIHAVRDSSRGDSRVLRDAVRAFAVRSREQHLPPERVIRELKALVRELALDDGTESFLVLYTDRVIAWAIEAYYELAEG